MTWKDINVFQYQQLNELFLKGKDLEELDLAVKASAICMNMTENEIDSLGVQELNGILSRIKFIHTELKGEPQKFIKVKGRRYKCVYDVRKIPAARYIETKHFGEDVNANLHKIAACMVIPMKRTLFGWVEAKYDASKHEDYAQDMLEAPVTAVVGSVVFFYQVYKNWIRASKDYLMQEMMTKKMTKYQAEATYQILCDTMDGFTKLSLSPTTRRLRLRMLIASLQFNSLTTSLISKQKENTKQSN